ncbi:hypothetical protein [Bordetella genomosp. 9]|nr:hypothetical protein [Bordetella genomosp. 9]
MIVGDTKPHIKLIRFNGTRYWRCEGNGFCAWASADMYGPERAYSDYLRLRLGRLVAEVKMWNFWGGCDENHNDRA